MSAESWAECGFTIVEEVFLGELRQLGAVEFSIDRLSYAARYPVAPGTTAEQSQCGE